VEHEEDATEVVAFDMIERIREAAAPAASLHATAIAAVRLLRRPCVLLTAAWDDEDAAVIVTHRTESLSDRNPVVVEVGLAVPRDSVMARVCGTRQPEQVTASEDQGWWQASTGPLPSVPIAVAAVSRAEQVYALVSPQL